MRAGESHNPTLNAGLVPTMCFVVLAYGAVIESQSHPQCRASSDPVRRSAARLERKKSQSHPQCRASSDNSVLTLTLTLTQKSQSHPQCRASSDPHPGRAAREPSPESHNPTLNAGLVPTTIKPGRPAPASRCHNPTLNAGLVPTRTSRARRLLRDSVTIPPSMQG